MYCRTINEISKDIKEWLYHQPSVNEESITDRLLYSLSKEVPGIYYKGFTRIEEGRRTGADWEWWIIFNDGSYRFRVQAKKEKADNYQSLIYTNTHGLQIEMLINDAITVNAIPLYAFYSGGEETTMCKKQMKDEGVFLSSANELYNEYVLGTRSKVNIKDILSKSNPLTCFFCCPLIRGNADGFRGYLREYYHTTEYMYVNVDEEYMRDKKKIDEIGFYQEYPAYLDSVMTIEPLPNWFEDEFRHYIDGVRGVLIVDLRNDTYED